MTRLAAAVLLARVALPLASAALGACAVARPFVADSGDLADYRAFRVAAHPGARLARARRYLDAHPKGAWADEVAAAWEAEEPAYFESAKASRERTREYLADLPNGPHAAAALTLLIAFDMKVDDVEMAQLMKSARRTEALLDRASAQRRAVGERILAWLAPLLDVNVYGARFGDAPAELLRALDGPARRTWGRTPTQRTEELFFSVPTRLERESRVASLTLGVAAPQGVIVETRIEGKDLFIRWLEADEMAARADAAPEDRAAAAAHAREVLAGALEARLPAARCGRATADGATLTRACDGLVVEARMGAAAGDADVIKVRARDATK